MVLQVSILFNFGEGRDQKGSKEDFWGCGKVLFFFNLGAGYRGWVHFVIIHQAVAVMICTLF